MFTGRSKAMHNSMLVVEALFNSTDGSFAGVITLREGKSMHRVIVSARKDEVQCFQ